MSPQYVEDAETIQCSCCGQHKAIDDYTTNGKRKDGSFRLMPYCKPCERVRMKRYRSANPYHYEDVPCNTCGVLFKVRVNKEPGTIGVLCKSCFSEAENK